MKQGTIECPRCKKKIPLGEIEFILDGLIWDQKEQRIRWPWPEKRLKDIIRCFRCPFCKSEIPVEKE